MNQQSWRVLVADNPWLEGAGIEPWLERLLPERFVPRRLRLEADHRVCMVVGPRQAGKSTLIWKALSERGTRALWLNCEEPSIAEWLRSPAQVLADIAGLDAEVQALFLEEVQRLPEAGLLLKGLVDRRSGINIYATGSSGFDLEAGTRESLAGRALRHLLLPFSLAELAADVSGGPTRVEAAMPGIVARRLVQGCYPTVVTGADWRRELATLVEAFVVRDVSDRLRIRHPSAVRKVLELAASQVGNLVNLSEWGAVAGVHGTTVADYCRMLEEAHVIRLVRPFVGGKRAELTGASKVYLIDNGVRNQLFGGFAAVNDRADAGPLMENLIFAELAKGINPLLDGLHFWRSRSGAEVDFVLTRHGYLTAVEVKAGDARGRLTRAARSFIDAYRPERMVVVHRGERACSEHLGTPVLFVRPWEVQEAVASGSSE